MSAPQKRRSVLQFIFGDDIGEMIGVILYITLMLVVFMGGPQLLLRWNSSSANERNKILEQVPGDTRAVLEELAVVQKKTQGLISKLQSDIRNSEDLLGQKKKTLEDLQHQIELLKLTPEQLAVIESYNQSVAHDPAFIEWITRKSTRYELTAAFVVSFIFYRLGVRSGKKHGYRG
ncbi:MAG TPA: hypothetical protein VJU77_03140 [Chthoniobacterales bacterium]|nr:hypothetical protein [Chthoniobacterales bacterium]